STGGLLASTSPSRAAVLTGASKQPLRDKAEALRQERRYDEARALAETALRSADRAQPPDEFNTLWWLLELGLVLQEQGHYTQAEPHFLRALTLSQRLFGAESVAVAQCLGNLALNERGQGRFI